MSGPPGAGKTTLAHATPRHAQSRPRPERRAERPGLEPLRELARLRVVHCTVDGAVAALRIRRREQDELRAVHEAPDPLDAAQQALLHDAFQRVAVDAPWLEVDTTDGYRPGLDEIAAFVR
ncbi:hypothetical protein [Amycolatopsis sacchari]|uniref:hypothetical protein n=1 Tax=Amycolatopsis sacchari TaxID=115433 RepID=UPI003D71D631